MKPCTAKWTHPVLPTNSTDCRRSQRNTQVDTDEKLLAFDAARHFCVCSFFSDCSFSLVCSFEQSYSRALQSCPGRFLHVTPPTPAPLNCLTDAENAGKLTSLAFLQLTHSSVCFLSETASAKAASQMRLHVRCFMFISALPSTVSLQTDFVSRLQYSQSFCRRGSISLQSQEAQ